MPKKINMPPAEMINCKEEGRASNWIFNETLDFFPDEGNNLLYCLMDVMVGMLQVSIFICCVYHYRKVVSSRVIDESFSKN